jgi:hypothetical protein
VRSSAIVYYAGQLFREEVVSEGEVGAGEGCSYVVEESFAVNVNDLFRLEACL